MLPLLFGLPSYGLMLALALLVTWGVTRTLARRDRLPTGAIDSAFVFGTFAGLAAARVGWLLSQPGDGAGHSLVALRGGELAPIAGITAAGIVGGFVLMRRRIPVVAGYDVVAPGLAIGAAIERIGGLFSGVGFGAHAPDLPWAIRFPEGSPAWLAHQQDLGGLIRPDAALSLPVHPTQIYGIIVAGIALGLALTLRRRRRFSGQVFLGTMAALLLGRAWVEEWFRADAGSAVLGPLSSAQVSSFVLAAALLVIAWARGVQARAKPQEYQPWLGGRWSPAPTKAEVAAEKAKAVANPSAEPAVAKRSKLGEGRRPPKGKKKGKGKSKRGRGRRKR